MEHHAWRITTHSGEEHSGVDSFPKPHIKQACKRLEFVVRGQPRTVTVDLKPGDELVCKRVNRITVSERGTEVGPRTAKYVLGKIADGVLEVGEFAEIR